MRHGQVDPVGEGDRRLVEVRVLFEEQPLILIVLVLVLVEVWLRVREPFFALLARLMHRTKV